ncbi:MAG TPA: hypothetical protein VJ978_10655, partial [Nitriliruptoraceae bacterium]|nr:hypothetical protein [Nitriliruptoraceae bacterium]
MHILMFVMSDAVHDPRVRIESETLVEAGHRVTVIGHQAPAIGSEGIPGVRVEWTHPRPRPARVPDASTWIREKRPTTDRSVLDSARRVARSAARWMLLPEHRARVQGQSSRRSIEVARSLNEPVDV